MSTKTKESLKIVSQEEIGTGIFSMWLQADRMAELIISHTGPHTDFSDSAIIEFSLVFQFFSIYYTAPFFRMYVLS